MTTADWSTLGTGIATGLIAFLTVWNTYSSKRREKKVDTLQRSTEENKTSLAEIHKATNSEKAAILQLGMTSAETLANVTKRPDHVEMAQAARNAYEGHVSEQLLIDAQKNAEGIARATAQGLADGKVGPRPPV